MEHRERHRPLKELAPLILDADVDIESRIAPRVLDKEREAVRLKQWNEIAVAVCRCPAGDGLDPAFHAHRPGSRSRRQLQRGQG